MKVGKEQFAISCANAGEHREIFELLVSAGAAPSREDFLTAQDNPYYEPTDRLLARLGSRLIGHLQICRRTMQFAGLPLPIAVLKSLVVLPEYRELGCAALLMQAVERLLHEEGTILSLLETRTPERFREAGWIECGRQCHVRAGAREIRAHLAEQPVSRGQRRPLSTRIWRHVELRQLTELYRQAIARSTGPLDRSEDYWQWLISRQAYDQILLAIEGNDTLEFGEQAPAIVGYAITREARVVEIVAEGQREDILRQLLVRACREAIEGDHHTLRVHVPPGDALGKLLADDRTSRISNVEYSVEHTLTKVIDPAALVGRMFPLLHARARAANLDRPLELNLAVDDVLWQLTLSRRSARLALAASGRADATLDGYTFPALLLGQADLLAAKESGRLKTRSKAMLALLDELFPRIRWWRPSLDDLPA
jgi:predicted acetyltransferase